eukprot:6840397-Pyramimonas_sp.AAC.2
MKRSRDIQALALGFCGKRDCSRAIPNPMGGIEALNIDAPLPDGREVDPVTSLYVTSGNTPCCNTSLVRAHLLPDGREVDPVLS